MKHLRRSWPLAATAVLTLAVGTGVNVTLFSLADVVVLRPFPFPAQERPDVRRPRGDGVVELGRRARRTGGGAVTASEELVFEGLRRLQRRRTTFVIAHRLSTVHAADTILVLDQGRIVGQGTHEELIRTNHLYVRLAAQLEEHRAA